MSAGQIIAILAVFIVVDVIAIICTTYRHYKSRQEEDFEFEREELNL